jgi:leucyl-tRNA synthetase
MGWDAFGLPAENAAIKRGVHPASGRYENIAAHEGSSMRWGVLYDWSKESRTCDPEYYRWNQWLFLRMFERGWPTARPRRSTGARTARPCWPTSRSSTALRALRHAVDQEEAQQWYLRITDYADRLLDDIDAARGHWPEKV